MTSVENDKRRAWTALDLGPLWMLQGPSQPAATAAPSGADASTGSAALVSESVGVAASGSDPAAALTDSPVSPMSLGSSLPTTVIADMSWSELQSSVSGCERCALSGGRTNTVFGVGDAQPKWLIVGEAPGANEDRVGEPFVGEAGQLLDAMLASVGISRAQGVFIINVLKCRPPGNRDPQPDEVASCREYLDRQIALLKPNLILAMGRFAAQTLLKTDASIGTLRKEIHRVDVGGSDYPLVVGYHPAYLLRKPEAKVKAWQDLCLARSVCDPTATGLL